MIISIIPQPQVIPSASCPGNTGYLVSVAMLLWIYVLWCRHLIQPHAKSPKFNPSRVTQYIPLDRIPYVDSLYGEPNREDKWNIYKILIRDCCLALAAVKRFWAFSYEPDGGCFVQWDCIEADGRKIANLVGCGESSTKNRFGFLSCRNYYSVSGVTNNVQDKAKEKVELKRGQNPLWESLTK